MLAETRDGRPLLEELHGVRPHLRQVIIVRPRYQIGSLTSPAPAVAPSVAVRPEAEVAENTRQRAIEGAYYNARVPHVSRLHHETSTLESVSLIGKRPRQALFGALSMAGTLTLPTGKVGLSEKGGKTMCGGAVSYGNVFERDTWSAAHDRRALSELT